jgi:hypothetical protein
MIYFRRPWTHGGQTAYPSFSKSVNSVRQEQSEDSAVPPAPRHSGKRRIARIKQEKHSVPVEVVEVSPPSLSNAVGVQGAQSTKFVAPSVLP